MKSLCDARAELLRLQHRESELLQEIVVVRKAVANQKVVIDELIKASAVPFIDRLPNELLIQIFLLIKLDRERLARVSRRWRAIVIDIPGIWSEIDLEYYWLRKCPALKLHLARSRQTPLAILDAYDLRELEVVLPHANRFHTLEIIGNTENILSRISRVKFPSLQYLSIDGRGESVDILPRIQSCVPALKHLELLGWRGPSSVSQIIAAESLEELSLREIASDWKFKNDSMHFPSLQRLTLDVRSPISFLESIIAPKLVSFCYTAAYCDDPIPTKFGENWSKFNNVSRLTFTLPRFQIASEETLLLSRSLCHIFRGIRYADIQGDYVSMLFSPCMDGRSPLDNWTCLETLDIRDFTFSSLRSFKCIVTWFTKRRNLGKRKLHFKLMQEHDTDDLVMLNASNALYQTLQDCCASVVFDRVAVSC
ncbi:hypothetical protein F5J12DRAFT_40152 [Pisolithus orientalis]|uniref:uncharacterized protein n=1 Tax=Pisolithus orientalis TaxID=936130 RepID=UPI002225254F|nr:uncharacterized protein F5J12DRAFT_40152 [Pisolithus orientalis]KAI6009488.1 hypothetical protein F5J12DRAFT_40152 [Pisolithus orientalis]